MASTALARVTGTVLKIDVRTGNARATGNPYRIETARILVEQTDISEVVIPDDLGVRIIEGEDVDLLAEFSVGPRGDLRARASKVLTTV